MQTSDDCYFMLKVGGYFSGYSKLTIRTTDDGFVGCRDSFLLGDSENPTFEISDEDIRELDEKLMQVGAHSWFTHYNNYCALDGTQWKMRIRNLEYDGSNLYPIGFFELCNFVAEKFDCPGLYWKEAKGENEYPSEFDAQFLPPIRTSISFLAEHHSYLKSCKDMKELIDEWSLTEDEARREIEKSIIAFAHDLHLVIDQTPDCSNYYNVLEEIGTGMDINAIKMYDVSKSDERTILALMTAMTRADHFSGRDGYFREFAADGVFTKWLDRLSELVERYPQC